MFKLSSFTEFNVFYIFEAKIRTKIILTVLGEDRVGIVAAISKVLAESDANIEDISQAIMQDIFSMIMLVGLGIAPVIDIGRFSPEKFVKAGWKDSPAFTKSG